MQRNESLDESFETSRKDREGSIAERRQVRLIYCLRFNVVMLTIRDT